MSNEKVRENSRQRILTTLSHRQPDRCPTFIWINDDAMEQLKRYMRVRTEEEVKEELGIDKWKDVKLKVMRPEHYKERINSLIPSKYKSDKRYFLTDEGRVVRIHEGAHYLEDTVWYPLGQINEVKDLDVYPFLQPDWIKVEEEVKNKIGKYKKGRSFVLGYVNQLFKSAWLLRGMHNVLMDYLINPDLINKIYEKIYSFNLAYCENLVRAGVDMVGIVGDIAMQNGLMMSPEVWRKFEKGRLEKLVSRLKNINPKLKIFMHTDGDVREIIEDLIEVGLDVLNPIQPECMNPVEIKRKYGDRLVLHGGVSLQKTLPFGSPEDVKEEVRYLIKNCNINGGFVFGPSNVIFKEIPPENVVAMYRTIY